MKILWVTNVPLPEASKLFNLSKSISGGWLVGLSGQLKKCKDVELSVLFPINRKYNNKSFVGNDISYYTFPSFKNKTLKEDEGVEVFLDILEKIKPDIVHIFGTELPHSLAVVNACRLKKIQTVVSIQGLVSIIKKHIFSSLPFNVVYGKTIRNIILGDSVNGLRKLYSKLGENEIQVISKADFIIGRTNWDKACATQINPKIKYFTCNETLRDEFYEHTWNIEKCEKNSIFMSQTHYPLKGLHFVLEALPIILNNFPNTRLYIAGRNIFNYDTLTNKLKITNYGKYINYLISKYSLENSIVFTGPLNELEMCKQYLKSNVFICPSTIENSPNSLGEAMILGVPCVASYVGGIPDLIDHNVEGFLFQGDAPYMIAKYVCEIFENEDLAKTLSSNAKKRGMKTHDRLVNFEILMNIYTNIIENKK